VSSFLRPTVLPHRGTTLTPHSAHACCRAARASSKAAGCSHSQSRLSTGARPPRAASRPLPAEPAPSGAGSARALSMPSPGVATGAAGAGAGAAAGSAAACACTPGRAALAAHAAGCAAAAAGARSNSARAGHSAPRGCSPGRCSMRLSSARPAAAALPAAHRRRASGPLPPGQTTVLSGRRGETRGVDPGQRRHTRRDTWRPRPARSSIASELIGY